MTLNSLTLTPIKRTLSIGDEVGNIEPNVSDDCILVDPDGSHVGLFIKKLPADLQNLVNIADTEILTKRVPKSEMRRSSGLHNEEGEVKQYSTILGSCPPKPHMRRPYASRSSVHAVKSAETFAKAMNAAGQKAFQLVEKYIPSVADFHKERIEERVPKKWRFAKYFTSTISNCNISAPVHQDHANVKGGVNIIITKRRNSKGGNLHVPDYGATFEQTDNSMLVYPAWRNMHGVTPIIPTYQKGYRNSHVWYVLDSFANLD
tara:strand:- start:1510 stop:2292 length:783 start_codon:yes stop_codon:yes gene_type:complete